MTIESVDRSLHVEGARQDLDMLSGEVKAELAKEGSEGFVRISEPVPVRSKLGSRGAQGQIELFSIVFAVATGVASSALYDGLKLLIDRVVTNKKIKVKIK